jgi:hypothetical protein
MYNELLNPGTMSKMWKYFSHSLNILQPYFFKCKILEKHVEIIS